MATKIPTEETFAAYERNMFSDDQLQELLDFYTAMEAGAKALGSHYHLFWVNIFNNRENLERIKQLRRRNSVKWDTTQSSDREV